MMLVRMFWNSLSFNFEKKIIRYGASMERGPQRGRRHFGCEIFTGAGGFPAFC